MSGTVTVETPGRSECPVARGQCPSGNRHVDREEVRRVMKECQEDSFWYRALPLSLGSTAITGGLIYNGVLKSSQRFGPFPKLAVAGILGYVVGKASYIGTCREKFRKIGFDLFGPGFGYCPLASVPLNHRDCHNKCEECKKETANSAKRNES